MTENPVEIHIVDLDHTLALGDTFAPFLFGLLRVHRRLILKLPNLAWQYLRFRLGLIENHRAKELFLSVMLADTAPTIASRWATQFAGMIRLNRSLESRLRKLQEQGAIVVIASASPDIYVNELAARLKIQHVVCTQLERDSQDAFTGALQTPNCYGEEKRRRVQKWLESQPAEPRTYFYTDHHSDLPLLKIVDYPIMVNPTRKLVVHGSALGFKEFDEKAAADIVAPACAAKRALK